MKKLFLFGIVLLCMILPLSAQDFGFGFDDEADTSGGGNNSPVSIGGEVSGAVIGYINDFSDGADHVRLGDIFSGKLNFTARTSIADAFISMKITPTESPITLDEAYIHAYFGSFDIQAGLRKIVWGKADSFGALDVINPLDYTELTDLSDMLNLKIARPLIHASYRIGSFSKIEGVFVPFFEPIRFASEGRWVPAQMSELPPLPINTPDTTTLNYAQAGMRFTTTIGPADVGLQYYYGRLTKPAITLSFAPSFPPMPTAINFAYNPYHQIGVDWAQVLFGFNIRAEFAANITEDTSGDDGTIYNPFLSWSFGFDRDLFWGININIQANETITLLHNNIGSNPMADIEAGSGITYTQIIARLSKKFLRDELEAGAALMWGVEDLDFLVIPSLIWTKNDVSIELSCGIFGGDKAGQLGQYHNNSFIKAGLSYNF